MRKENIERLNLEKERKEEIKEIKNLINLKTNKEYFFKMNSIDKIQNNKKINKLKLIHLNFEILKYEKKKEKLINKNNLKKIKNDKIIFSGDEEIKVIHEIEWNVDEEKEIEIEKYLRELKKTKQKILKLISKT